MNNINKNIEKIGDPRAVKYINLRNKFFSIMYRSSLLLLLLSIIMFILSFVFLYAFSSQPVNPRYITLKEDGRYIELIRVDQEHKTPEDVAAFVAKAVKKVYTRDYLNYTDQLMEASEFFTPKGMNTYLDSLEKSQNLNSMKQNRWVLTFTPKAPPVLLEKKVNNGVYTWAYEFSGQILYSGEKNRTQNVKIQVIVERMSMVDSSYGMGIATFVPFEIK